MKKNKVGTRNEIVEKLKNAIVEADYDSAPKIMEEALRAGVKPRELMEKAISAGIEVLEKKCFGDSRAWGHPMLYLGFEAARRSMLILEPHFKPPEEGILGTVVLGTPAGDVHDMGGKMVALALMAAGFRVIYLGRDVPSSLFVHKIKESGAQILAISVYQTNGIERITEILNLLSQAGIRDKVKVMAGGCAITEKFTNKVGIGYAKTASGAVSLAKEYIGGK